MWEAIVAYLLKEGGMYGLLLALSLVWIFWRERNIIQKKDQLDNQNNEQVIEKIDIVISDIEELKKIVIRLDDKVEISFKEISNIKNDIVTHVEFVAKINSKIKDISSMTKDLYHWHETKDADGLPIWYGKSTASSMKKLVEEAASFSNMTSEISRINEERVDELRSVLLAYNKTIVDLTLALEKIKFSLENKGI